MTRSPCTRQILDGRERLAVCYAASIEPQFHEYTGDDPDGYMWQRNLCRAHFSREELYDYEGRVWRRLAARGDIIPEQLAYHEAEARRELERHRGGAA